MEIYRPRVEKTNETKEDKSMLALNDLLVRPPHFDNIGWSHNQENQEMVSVWYDVGGCRHAFGLKTEGNRLDHHDKKIFVSAESTVNQICETIASVNIHNKGLLPKGLTYINNSGGNHNTYLYKFSDIDPMITKIAREQFPDYLNLSLLQIGQNLLRKDIRRVK
jgi:hypothetical protein